MTWEIANIVTADKLQLITDKLLMIIDKGLDTAPWYVVNLVDRIGTYIFTSTLLSLIFYVILIGLFLYGAYTVYKHQNIEGYYGTSIYNEKDGRILFDIIIGCVSVWLWIVCIVEVEGKVDKLFKALYVPEIVIMEELRGLKD